MAQIICASCRSPYPDRGAPTHCGHCGGQFCFDGHFPFSPLEIDGRQPGMWRYRRAFDLPPAAPVLTLGEGRTPLIWTAIGETSVGLKLESLNPTGSYKDRGAALIVSRLVERGITEAVEDSSGNAGASFAAYAARAGIHAKVFIPESASGPKRAQIEAHGAELIRVPGPRSAAAQAVMDEVRRGSVYASHAYLPFGLAGIASIAYEIWEEMGMAPGTIVAPAGHGGLLCGLAMGFAALDHARLIPFPPYFIGVQAANCAPLAAAFSGGIEAMAGAKEGATIAEGVRVRWPSQAAALLRLLPPGHGEIAVVEEEKILPAWEELARLGIYAEPTSALVWAAVNNRINDLPEPIVMIISGHGLKFHRQ